ncbi:hypothetical protein B0J15DRAFT_558361, partial [Fusarium solani]
MIPRASLLLALSLVCIESAIAGPCKPGTTSTLTSSSETESATSHTASSTTVVTTDSTTSGSGTDSTTASLTLTESSTESTTFLSTTSSVSVSSDSTTLSTSEASTSLSTQTSTTSTSPQPDSTGFNIIPGSGSAASGFLKVRTLLGGEVYFNNPYTTYQTGVFVVSGATRRLIERGSQSICAYFRTGRGYGDLNGCRPETDPDLRLVPLTCQLTASAKLQCSVPGKFCYYQGDMLTCDDRGTYSSLYLDTLSGAGYRVIIGPSDLNWSPVELVAAPI